MVIWSYDREATGKRYPENEELDEALRGEIVSEMSTGEELERKYHEGREPEALLELYVPVTFPPETGVKAVFEIYQNVTHILADRLRDNNILLEQQYLVLDDLVGGGRGGA